MAYVAIVLAQTLILPVVFGISALSGHDHAWLPIVATFGRWFLFWGVGTRLALAGIVQVVKPDFTTGAILGDAPSGAKLVARELGFANLAMGTGGIVGAFVGGGLAAAITGGLYFGVAGVLHLGKRDMNVKEHVATWTDLLMLVAMTCYVIALILMR
jgi:arginine exporter protein ArgO